MSTGYHVALMYAAIKFFVRLYHRVRVFSLRIRYAANNIYIAPGSFIDSSVTIGRYTRINQPSHLQKCSIGSFCAIGGRLIVRGENHDMNYMNMQDFFQKKILKSRIRVAGKSKGHVSIGHGAWIGDSVVILSGVHIGNGAVIGAGSVVTKSIPDYAVAVGNPARVIRYRFPDNVRAILFEVRWWEWSIEKMIKWKELFEMDMTMINQDVLVMLLKKIQDDQ